VRSLIAAERLPAERVGARYVLDPGDVAELVRLKRPGGRPLSARNAWALLAELSGYPEAASVSPRSYFRLRHLLDADAGVIADLLAGAQARSIRHAWRVLPSDLGKLAADPRLVPSGLAADDPLIGIRYQVARDGFDAYVGSADLRVLKQGYQPQLDSAVANVVLRVPLDNSWILDQRRAPSAVVAADLLSHRDARVRRAAHAALGRVVHGD
jgi:hypothetical protein